MNTILLIFFAIPLAVIIFSIVLQKLIKCPALVAGIVFSILLIVVLAFFDFVFLLAVIAYTILSFITAFITSLVCRFINNERCSCNNERRCRCGCRERRNCCCDGNDNDSDENTQLLTINSTCQNGRNGNLLTISSNDRNGCNNDLLTIDARNNNNSCNCRNCGCSNNFNNSNDIITLSANGTTSNNERTGRCTGCYRRR